jgi:protocadherin-16/23
LFCRYFSVAKDGTVRTKEEFDREAKDVYHLNVLANDMGDPPQTNIISLAVQIDDANDNTPFFVRYIHPLLCRVNASPS